MASQFDPYAPSNNPLSIVDSDPFAKSLANPSETNDSVHSNIREEVHLDHETSVRENNEDDNECTNNNDDENANNDEDQESVEEEYSSDNDSDDEEDYPMDYLDVEGWNNRRRCASSSDDDDEEEDNHSNDISTQYREQLQGEARGCNSNNNNNKSSNRKLFSWMKRRPNPTEEDYSALPSGMDESTTLSNHNDDVAEEDISEEPSMDNELRPGDHIYIWQTYGINHRAYQRHAVVLSITPLVTDDQEDAFQTSHSTREDDLETSLSYNIDDLYRQDCIQNEVTVVSFYHYQRGGNHGSTGKGKRSGCKTQSLHEFIGPDELRRKKPLHKVQYGSKIKRGILNQKIVGTALHKDVTGLILARIRYLLDHPGYLPQHHALSANGECAALWCVTGRWCTLQGASILQITCVGQAGGALVAGGILSNLTVLVPMPGLWGMAGWWWYVPATVAYPFLVPMLVALGMCSLVPLEILRRNRKKWRGITERLNHEFWSNASEDVKEEYFGLMATAEREAEMRRFFGVREGESADDAKYMPVGGTPGGVDDSDDEEDEALALQKMERRCQSMMADMDVDLSGKPPSQKNSRKGWSSFVGNSFRRKDVMASDERQKEQESIIS